MLATGAILALVGSVSAQQRIGSSSGSSMGSSGSGFSGSSSSSGFTGSSSGSGFTGSSTGFTGSSTGFTGGTTGSSSRGGTGSYGQSSPYGTYYANPFALGLATGSVGSGASGTPAATCGRIRCS